MSTHATRGAEVISRISEEDKACINKCVEHERFLPAEAAKRLIAPLDALRENVVKVIRGMDDKLELFEIAMISPQDLFRGMTIIEGAQGSGKTVLAEAYAGSIADATYGRIQATGDMLPSQITGFNQFDRKTGEWVFRETNLYRNFVNVDDATRMPGKVSAAMLQPIAESEMTVDSETRPMPDPFWLVCTQNPVDQHGTYPQVEAFKDRAMFLFSLGQPTLEALEEILRDRRWKDPLKSVEPVVCLDDFRVLQDAVRTIYMHPLLEKWIARLVEATIVLAHPLQILVHLDDALDEMTLKELVATAVRQGSMKVSPEIVHEAQRLAPEDTEAAKRSLLRMLKGSSRNKKALDELVREKIHVLLSAASVRAQIALQNGTKARALRRGRHFVLPEDIEALFLPVFNHRVRFEDAFDKRVAALSGDKEMVYKEFQELCFFLAPAPQVLDWSAQ